jgi:hypothetical protein
MQRLHGAEERTFMGDASVQPAAEVTPGLSQWERVVDTFTAPSKTFLDIKNGHRSWWMPFLIVLLTGGFMWFSIYHQVTWRTLYDNQQRSMPEFAKRMMEQQPPEVQAAREKSGPISQAVTWAISPLGLLAMNAICALVLWPTINFGFGGKANFGSIFAVTMYATLILWPLKLLLGGLALWAGATPEAFDIQNIAGTNFGYYMEVHKGALYLLATSVDVLVIWNLFVTGIGVATVAGVKRSSGYIAVFGWWILIVLISVGFAAAFS